MVTGAIVWQRVMGSVDVSIVTGAVVMDTVAALVSGAINDMTLRVVLLDTDAV